MGLGLAYTYVLTHRQENTPGDTHTHTHTHTHDKSFKELTEYPTIFYIFCI